MPALQPQSMSTAQTPCQWWIDSQGLRNTNSWRHLVTVGRENKYKTKISLSLFSPSMSDQTPTPLEDLLSTLLDSLFCQSLQPSAHTPHKQLMRTSKQRLPKKQKTLISSDQIDALPDTSCCSSACLSKFSYTDLLAITMPYAELNKHQQTQFIINTMSVTCISLVPSCHFSLRLNGTPVCLTTFQKVPANTFNLFTHHLS